MEALCIDKQHCCGCSACVNVCPRNAITLVSDEEGFSYPTINKKQCIECGLCKKACSFCTVEEMSFGQKYYEVKASDSAVRKRSRSGGAFFLVAQKVIESKGVVYGVAKYGTNVTYSRAQTLEELIPMQGSKYVECPVGDIFRSVEQDIKNDRWVLFSGTACRVAGLYGFLKGKKLIGYQKLLTMDIVCHGVPSIKIYDDYILYLTEKYRGKIDSFDFRDKAYGWNTHVESFSIKNKKRTSDIYSGLFYSNLFLRPSCECCPFASYNRPADITIADFVGSERVKNNFNDNKGLSMIMINSEEGAIWFDKIKDNCECVSLDKDVTVQPNLLRPSPFPPNREQIWNFYHKHGFRKMLKKYGRNDFIHRIKWYLKDYPELKKKKLEMEKK